MKTYKVLVPTSTFQRTKDYQQQLLQQKITAGFYLSNALKTKNLATLSTELFLELIVQTKEPQIFAESTVRGDGFDWNQEELSILGDISVAVPVTIFDNGAHRYPLVYEKPFEGTLLYTPGALLRNDCGHTPADWEEVTQHGKIYYEGYYNLYKRRLLPVFQYVNSISEYKEAILSIPGLGCGMFAGVFQGQLGEYLKQVLVDFLTENAGLFPNIRAVYYDPYNECKNERFEIKGISLMVRPLTQNNTGKSQLSESWVLEDKSDDFSNCQLCSIVAWDHVSWPGNDFYVGSRATDDGVKAAATDSMLRMTGQEGHYDKTANCYNPPTSFRNWEDVIIKNKVAIKVVGNLKIF